MPANKNPEEPVKNTAEAPETIYNKDGTPRKRMGRPIKEIDKEQFETLAQGGCTEEFIAKFFHCSIDTLSRWVKKNYQTTFQDFQRGTKQWRKSMISNKMFEVAMSGDTKMLIWLSKAWLGMSENGPKDEVQDKTSKLYEALDADDDEDKNETNEQIN